MSVVAASLHRDKAYARIRDLVISASSRPMSRCRNAAVGRLALGRTPVREALKALANDGLLTIHPMRGTFVRQLSFDDLREIHELRLALEGMAAYLGRDARADEVSRAVAKELRRVGSACDDRCGGGAAVRLDLSRRTVAHRQWAAWCRPS